MQVKVYNLTQYEHGADDVLVMGTDGLWDVLSNQEVAEAVTTFLANCDPDDLHRSAAFFPFFFLNFFLSIVFLSVLLQVCCFKSVYLKAGALSFPVNVKFLCHCATYLYLMGIGSLLRINYTLGHVPLFSTVFNKTINVQFLDLARA